MTPQIPGYLVSFESTVRPVVTVIVLSLIWLGAARMPASANSRYATAGVLSAVLIGWLAVAQYLGAANTYLANTESAVPIILFGLLIPLAVAAIALWGSDSIARLVSAIPLHWLVAAQVPTASPAVYSSCFGLTGACPGNSRCRRGLGTLRRAALPSSWLRCWHKTQLALAGQHTPGAFSESPTSSWPSRWAQ
ncbi:MAG: hypothetical protein WBD97_13330 [Pseudolabrys sp.]